VIQAASEAAVHSHSGVVTMEMVPVSPLALTGAAGAVSVRSHFGPPGPTDDSLVVAPHAVVASAATTIHNNE
jgi:hypothetical protein